VLWRATLSATLLALTLHPKLLIYAGLDKPPEVKAIAIVVRLHKAILCH